MMIEPQVANDCPRCRGTGTTSPLKGRRLLAQTMLCSCSAGRGIAAHVGLVIAQPERHRVYGR